jgi:hypothetical protein
MIADVLVIPAILAVVVGILAWNARAGLIVGALLLCAEMAVLAYPHYEKPQHCLLSDSCKAAVTPPAASSTASDATLRTASPVADP